MKAIVVIFLIIFAIVLWDETALLRLHYVQKMQAPSPTVKYKPSDCCEQANYLTALVGKDLVEVFDYRDRYTICINGANNCTTRDK